MHARNSDDGCILAGGLCWCTRDRLYPSGITMLKVPARGPIPARIMLVGEAPGLPERILAKIVRIPECGCWVWEGSISGYGYGETWWNNSKKFIHVLMHELFVGEVPDGFKVDHLCRVRCCCNPEHLEAVTHAENVKRGTGWQHVVEKHKAATHCQRGHPWIEENTYVEPNGKRRCLECKRMRLRNWRAKNGS